MRFLSLSFFAFLLSWSAAAQDYVATPADYAAVLDRYFPADGTGATAIIVKGGEVVYHAGHGMAHLELGVKMEADHVLRIGSITKQFTAMAILKLMEAGKLTLEDPLTKFVPDFPNGEKITVRHLLNHTSGIASYTDLEKWDEAVRRQDFTVAELIDFAKDEPTQFGPGEKWAYNNSGYVLLGAVIEKASGTTYEAYLQEAFFEPLGLEQTYYDNTARVIPKRVPGYSEGLLGIQNTDYLSMTQPYAAGSLLSTVADLSTWYHALANGTVVRPENFQRAITPARLTDGTTKDYGFGLGIGDTEGHRYFGHGGGINGFLTDSRYYPEENLFLAVFSNCNCKSPTPALGDLAVRALGVYDPNVASQPLTDHQRQQLPGTYRLAPGFDVEIRINDRGELEAQATGQGAFPLDATADPMVWTKSAFGIKVRFNADADGAVESLTLFQNGERNAPKIK